MTLPDHSRQRSCVCTISSDNFVAATLVTLSSFRRHNPDFGDDLIVFNGGLSADSQAQLHRVFPNLIIRRESSTLTDQLEELLIARPDLAGRRARFLSLEAFSLTGYDRVLFLDSDLLIQGSMSAFLNAEHACQAVPDGSHLAGGYRHPDTYEKLPLDSTPPPGAYRDTFNSGVMMIRPDQLPGDQYNTLLDAVSPAFWQKITAAQTDQIVLNICLQDRVTLADVTNNFMMVHRATIREKTGLNPADAAVLHFNGPGKPWMMERVLDAAQDDPAAIKATKLWQDEFHRLLQTLALKRV